MEELKKRLEAISKNLPEKKKRLEVLQAQAADPNLWQDQVNARAVMRQLADLAKEVEEIEELSENPTEASLRKLELKMFLSGEYDGKNALVAIHAGQGGVEAMDWASMLLRMYLKFCEKRSWQTEILDQTPGEEAGIKSITFRVEGAHAYGYLKGEAGTHRLVRQSPFNADRLRQTSFALVEVLPELEEVDLPDVVIKDEDLDWDFFRASSQGGQNVQKVSTAVRLTHKPTGIVVTAQSQRFQEQNRQIALNLLRAKLWLLAKTQAEKVKKGLKGDYRPASWGNQIRSYVLHPYKMVKDLRTQVETANTEATLNGELDSFIEAELKMAQV